MWKLSKWSLGNRERNLIWSGQATQPGEDCCIGTVGQASRFRLTSENSTVRALGISSKREPSHLMLDLSIRTWRPSHQKLSIPCAVRLAGQKRRILYGSLRRGSYQHYAVRAPLRNDCPSRAQRFDRQRKLELFPSA